MDQEVNVLALIKDTEQYVYVYDDRSRPALLEEFKSQADNGDLSLTWFDAAVLTQKAREQALAGSPEAEPPSSRFE